jgi:hypothetical protein
MAVSPSRIRPSLTAWLVALAVALCILEGSGRKWLLPDSSPVVQAIFYFSKDAALLLAAITAGNYRARSPEVHLFRQCLPAVALLLALATAASLSGATLVGSALSLRSMLVLPCLAVCIAPGLRSRTDLELIVRTVGLLSIGVAILGVLQFYLPAGHILNQRLARTEDAVMSLGRVRASGTFSYISGMADLAVAASWAGAYLLLVNFRNPLGYLFIVAGLTCTSAALSRSGIVWSFALLGLVLALSRRGIKAAVVVALILLVAWLYAPADPNPHQQIGIITGTAARHKVSDSFTERAMNVIIELLSALDENAAGNGLGSGQIGEAAYEVGTRKLRAYEGELARTVYETGIIGLFAVGLCRVSLLLLLWRSLVHDFGQLTRLAFLRRASLGALAVFFAGNTCFSHVASSFVWIIAAVALATCEIEATERTRLIRPRQVPGFLD